MTDATRTPAERGAGDVAERGTGDPARRSRAGAQGDGSDTAGRGKSGAKGRRRATAESAGRASPTHVATDAPTDAPAADLTIEGLAAEVGMSVRNIRNHHSRGLLPPPEVRARVGYYNAEHVSRLRLIQDLQADGFNLAAIERLLSGTDGLAEQLLGLHRAVTAPYEPEQPEVMTAAELLERFGEVDAKEAMRIRKLGLLVPLGDDRFEVTSPALMEAAEQLMALGISLHAGLGLVERVHRDCESISRAFVKLFLRELWEPFEEAGQPPERWDELIGAVGSLRPLASEALLALFKQRMTYQLEQAFGKVIEDQSKKR